MVIHMHQDNKDCLTGEELRNAPGEYLYRVSPGVQNDCECATTDPLPIIETIKIDSFAEACEKYKLCIIDA